jgi:recombination protein RecA
LKKAEVQDELAEQLVASINKQVFKDTGLQPASFLADPNVSDVTEWVPSGCSMLDLAMSNQPNGGYPVGRIVEINGLEGSGKSLLAAHAIANTQKMGGIGVFIDTEAATHRKFFQAVGVDIKTMIYIPVDKLEDAFAAIEKVVEKARTLEKTRLITIVLDSLMGASTAAEMKGGYTKEGYGMDKAAIASIALRKLTVYLARHRILLIVTNQLRENTKVTYGDPWKTSGGKALAFHASIRLRLTKEKALIVEDKNKVKHEVGALVRAKVVKNRLGPPGKVVNYSSYFNSGVDDFGSWMDMMLVFGLIKQNSSWYTYEWDNPETGERETFKYQGSAAFSEKLQTNLLFRGVVYEQLCAAYIMQYKLNENFEATDVVADSNFINEDD